VTEPKPAKTQNNKAEKLPIQFEVDVGIPISESSNAKGYVANCN
jgi:hypothetical protein